MNPINFKQIKTINSFGSTGVYFNTRLNEEFNILDLDKIECNLKAQGYNYTVTKQHEGQEEMPQDEWTITIHHKPAKFILSKKQEIISSLETNLWALADQGIQFLHVEDLEYSFTDPNNTEEELVCQLELYSQHGSQHYEDKVACKWLFNNGYLVKDIDKQISLRPNKWIIKTF